MLTLESPAGPIYVRADAVVGLGVPFAMLREGQTFTVMNVFLTGVANPVTVLHTEPNHGALRRALGDGLGGSPWTDGRSSSQGRRVAITDHLYRTGWSAGMREAIRVVTDALGTVSGRREEASVFGRLLVERLQERMSVGKASDGQGGEVSPAEGGDRPSPTGGVSTGVL